MMDAGFWIGSGVGFISATLGGLVSIWANHRFKLKELKYTTDREDVKRTEQAQVREESESQKFRNLIMDTRRDLRDRRDWDSLQRGFYGKPGMPAMRFLSESSYDEYFLEPLLKDMNLDELKAIYTALLSVPFVSVEIGRSLGEMSAMISDMHSKLVIPDTSSKSEK